MTEFFKKPIFIVIVVVAIFGALIWTYISNTIARNREIANQKQVETEQVTDLSTVDPTLYDDPIKNEYAIALNKAQEADKNNALSAISVEIPETLGLKSANTRYIFSSVNSATYNWTISISAETTNYIRAIIPKDDYMGNLSAMDTALWRFNYVTAFQIAEKNGGKEWRENNELKDITLSLKHEQPNNWLIWSVVYRGKINSFTSKIDANSGKMVAE